MSKIIEIVDGFGEARHALSSFDQALMNAGIGNYNLVYLSSVIPAGYNVKVIKKHQQAHPVGSIVPVVIARKTGKKNERACAGLAWAITRNGGVIVEGSGDDPKKVEEEILQVLEEIMFTRGLETSNTGLHVTCKTIKNSYGTAIVAAIFPALKEF